MTSHSVKGEKGHENISVFLQHQSPVILLPQACLHGSLGVAVNDVLIHHNHHHQGAGLPPNQHFLLELLKLAAGQI